MAIPKGQSRKSREPSKPARTRRPPSKISRKRAARVLRSIRQIKREAEAINKKIDTLSDKGLTHDLKNQMLIVWSLLKSASELYTNPKEALKYIRLAQSKLLHIGEGLDRYPHNVFSLNQANFSELSNSIKNIAMISIPEGEKRIRFKSNVRPDNKMKKIFVDSYSLKRLVTNLVFNANTAMKGEGEIKVSVKLYKDRLKIIVSDTGIGMDPQDVRQFYREGKVGRRFGLQNSKEIVDFHKGTIDVHSVLGKGTTFTINIPISK